MALNIRYALLGSSGLVTAAGAAFGIYQLTNQKPLREQLLSEGDELVIIEEGYNDVFDVFRDEQELIEITKTKNQEINPSIGEEIGGEALKAWCKENLEAYRSNSNTKKLMKKYCTKAPETIEQKLIKKGRKPVSNWSAKLTIIKGGQDKDDLLQDLKKGGDAPADLNANGVDNSLKEWCNENKTKDLSKGKENNLETKVNNRCFND